MTFTQLSDRFVAYWWMLPLLVVSFYLLGWNWVQKPSFESVFSVQVSLDPQYYTLGYLNREIPDKLILSQDIMSQSFAVNTDTATRYLQEFLSSLKAQKEIYNLSGLDISDVKTKPDYTVNKLGSSLIEVHNSFESMSRANSFNSSLQQILILETQKWNSAKPQMLQLNIQDKMTTDVLVRPKGVQMRLLPGVAALIVSLALIVILPYKQNGKTTE